MVANGFKVNQFSSETKFTPLQEAIFSLNFPVAKALISEFHADVNMRHPSLEYGYSAIVASQILGDSKLTQLLVEHGANLLEWEAFVNAYMFEFANSTPGEKSLNDFVKRQIQNTQFDSYDDEKFPLEKNPEILFLGAIYGSGDFFKAVLSSTSNLNTPCKFEESGNCSLLQVACYCNNSDIATTLVEDFGADVNYVPVKSKIGSPIESAIAWGNVELVQFLLDHGVTSYGIYQDRDILEVAKENYKSLQIIKTQVATQFLL